MFYRLNKESIRHTDFRGESVCCFTTEDVRRTQELQHGGINGGQLLIYFKKLKM